MHKRISGWYLVLEVSVTFTLLMLFISANEYQDSLWEAGGRNEWNSDPKMRIYFYANHKEPPDIPMIWSQEYVDSTSSKGLCVCEAEQCN